MGTALAEAERLRRAEGDVVGLEELDDRFTAGASEKYGGRAAAAAFRAYTRACQRHKTPPSPITAQKIRGFLVGECLRGVSSQRLGTIAAVLLRHVQRPPSGGAGAEVFDVDGDATSGPSWASYRTIIGRLQKEYPSEIKRRKTFSDGVLRRVRRYLAPFLAKGCLFAHSAWSMLLLNCAVGCRSKQLRGRAFTWSQVRLGRLDDGRPTVQLDLPFAKTTRAVRDRQRDVVAVPRRTSRDDDLDAVPAFLRYAALCGRSLGDTRGDAVAVFVRRCRRSGLPAARGGDDYSYKSCLADLHWVLQQAGLRRVHRWGLHSMRRTAATRYLRLGVDAADVMRLCGWASSASLEIYNARPTSSADVVSAKEQASAATGGPAPSKKRRV